MARRPRINLPDLPFHIVQRGNNRTACFHIEKDYLVYLDKLKRYASQHQVAIHAFVLMTNHVHILATQSEPNGISNMMQSIGRSYVMYFNRCHERTGTLWEGRYKCALVDTEKYFLLVSKYIELNPVRAKMVNHPADYPWSSFHANAFDKQIELLTPHFCYLQLGKSPMQRQVAYQALFDQHIDTQKLREIREGLEKNSVLGDKRFRQTIEQKTGLKFYHHGLGGYRKSQQFTHGKNSKV